MNRMFFAVCLFGAMLLTDSGVVATENGGLDVAALKLAATEYAKSLDDVRFTYTEEYFGDGKPHGLSFDVEVVFSGERYFMKKTGRPYTSDSIGPNLEGKVFYEVFDGETYQSFAETTSMLSVAKSYDSHGGVVDQVWSRNPLFMPLTLLFPEDKQVKGKEDLVSTFSGSEFEVSSAGGGAQLRSVVGGEPETWREIFWQFDKPFPYGSRSRPDKSPNAQIPGRNGVPEFAWSITKSDLDVQSLASVKLGGKDVVIPNVISYVVTTEKGAGKSSSSQRITIDPTSVRKPTDEELEGSFFQIPSSIATTIYDLDLGTQIKGPDKSQ